MIGGAQVTEQVKEYTGADAYGPDALAAVRLTKKWIGGQ
jgi:5-methyltetrahydrofolate--homocysteine methyltransferase